MFSDEKGQVRQRDCQRNLDYSAASYFTDYPAEYSSHDVTNGDSPYKYF